MPQKLDTLQETPSQTAGPFVHIGMVPTYAGMGGIYEEEIGTTTFSDDAKGDVIEITGTIIDGAGFVMRDGMFEAWQADANGIYPGQDGVDPSVSGWARVCVDPESGEWTLRTIKPGSSVNRDGNEQAPHIAIWVVARGINIGLQTRIYFDDEDNSSDPVLSRIEHKHRIETLLAKKTEDGKYRFDIRLQGEGETVFFDM
jgi:protocatechuate 3,4-dioxygenase alpha subunit